MPPDPARPEPGTREDLLSDAAAAGYAMQIRMIDEWRRLGFLGPPTRQRTGKTGQDLALYSVEQRATFRSLARLKANGVSNQRLATVPVFMWMTYGSPWVEIEQLRAAMLTYVGGNVLRSQRVAGLAAKAIVDNLPAGLPKGRSKDRAELKAAVADQLHSGVPNRKILARRVQNLFDSSGFSGRLHGGLELRPEMFVDWLGDPVRATSQFTTVADEMLEEARGRHQTSIAEYAELKGRIGDAPDPQRAMFNDLDLDTRVTHSPQILLLLLGQMLRDQNSGAA